MSRTQTGAAHIIYGAYFPLASKLAAGETF